MKRGGNRKEIEDYLPQEQKSLRHLIKWQDWPDQQLASILTLTQKIKKERHLYSAILSGRSLAMLFQKTSTRTRVSFEAAMTEMGGHAIYLDWEKTNFKLSTIGYEAAYLSRNTDLIMARMKKHEDLLELSESASVPLINGCCNRYHPCQAITDMFTIYEDQGSLEGVELAYIGVHNNVTNSLMETCAALGVRLTLVCPIVAAGVRDEAVRQTLLSRNLLQERLDLKQVVREVDYVYTDTWVDMEFFNSVEHKKLKEERIEIMMPYQLNEKLMEGSKAKILHDMPIHPNYEISPALVEDERSLIFQQAGNRLVTQKAIILRLLNFHLFF